MNVVPIVPIVLLLIVPVATADMLIVTWNGLAIMGNSSGTTSYMAWTATDSPFNESVISSGAWCPLYGTCHNLRGQALVFTPWANSSGIWTWTINATDGTRFAGGLIYYDVLAAPVPSAPFTVNGYQYASAERVSGAGETYLTVQCGDSCQN